MQQAACPAGSTLTSLVFILCATLWMSTTAESAGDIVRMMRKEDPSNSATTEPAAVPVAANLQDVHVHSQERAGSELDQKKDLSLTVAKDQFYSKDGSEALVKNKDDEASRTRVAHISNVIIMPKKGVIKQIQIPTKVVPPPAPLPKQGSGDVSEVAVPAAVSTSAEPHIVPYAGQHLSDPEDPPEEDAESETPPDVSTPRPTVMKTADRLRQEQMAARAAGGHLPKLAKPFVPPKPRHLQQRVNPDSLARIGSSSQIHRSDEGFQGMAQAAKELILEEELEKAEKQHHAAVAAGIIDPPHAEEPEEDGDKNDPNDDDDEEDRKRFFHHGRLSTVPPTPQQQQLARVPMSATAPRM
mmetsp:Transcript_111314/g.197155  ORF Transcript_111314/g.197155 Transcript_111314/m.197155 type:complete len:356 (-) Transcript_111314:57-1124(-)